jgi:hypothetical protein
MTVVSNSSPLIIFERISRFDLLEALFGEVTIPPAVRDEVFGSIEPPSWIRVVPPIQPLMVSMQIVSLGVGEREAISLAIETKAELLLLDDQAARRMAARLGVSIVGCAGLLLRAKRNGLIEAVLPHLSSMREAGLRISDELFDRAIRDSGEAA